MTRLSQWKDRRKSIEWPLFSGYCFARFTGDQKLVILQTVGVVEIIGSAQGCPEAIPDIEIAALQRVILARLAYDAHPHLEQGMAVEVIRGPLIGIQGRLTKKSGGTRLVASINLIGQGAAVHIDADHVAPLRATPEPSTPLVGQSLG